MAHRMRDKTFRQTKGISVGDEAGVDLRRLDPPTPLGHPQCWVFGIAELWADVLDVVGDRLDRPSHYRGDVATSRWLTTFGLAVADIDRAVPAELGCCRISPEVDNVQSGCFGAAKAPPVQHFEERGVPVRSQ